jgi:hypothetical protein
MVDTSKHEAYWDGGPQMIERFVEQHREPCQTNWICKALHLATAEVQDEMLTTPKKSNLDATHPLRIGEPL